MMVALLLAARVMVGVVTVPVLALLVGVVVVAVVVVLGRRVRVGVVQVPILVLLDGVVVVVVAAAVIVPPNSPPPLLRIGEVVLLIKLATDALLPGLEVERVILGVLQVPVLALLVGVVVVVVVVVPLLSISAIWLLRSSTT